MKKYIYIVVSRRTGEEVCRGTGAECAAAINCDKSHVFRLARRPTPPVYSSYINGRYEIKRVWC